MRHTPEIIEVDNPRLEEVLGRAEQALAPEDAALIRAVFESYRYVADLVEDKNTSIRRLRQLLFGGRTEKTAALVGDKDPTAAATSPSDSPADPTANAAAPSAANAVEAAPAARGHGRNGADAYRGAERIDVPHATLSAGDACPACGEGLVYDKAPGVVVRITGQPPLTARIYQLQKLRCHLCGEVFTAVVPAEAGDRKYDATAGSMIGLLKYGSGLPFNRLDGLQGYLEIPLPASTQWDIVKAVEEEIAPAFAELVRQAAQGDVLHNDDTTVKILALMGGQSEGPCRGSGGRCGRAHRPVHVRRGGAARRAPRGLVLQRPSPRRGEPGRGAEAPRRRLAAADPDVRCPLPQLPGRVADDPGPLPGSCPPAVRGGARSLPRAVQPPARGPGRGVP